jgi:hypothetical protein
MAMMTAEILATNESVEFIFKKAELAFQLFHAYARDTFWSRQCKEHMNNKKLM